MFQGLKPYLKAQFKANEIAFLLACKIFLFKIDFFLMPVQKCFLIHAYYALFNTSNIVKCNSILFIN